MAECCFWGSIQGGASLIGLSHRESSFVSPGSLPHSSAAIEVHAQDGQGRFRRRSLRFSETMDHAGALRKFYSPFADTGPDVAGSGGCQIPPTHLLNRKMAAEMYPARHSSTTQEAVRPKTMSDVCLWPGPGNSAGGPTEQKCDTAPVLPKMMGGAFSLGLFVLWRAHRHMKRIRA